MKNPNHQWSDKKLEISNQIILVKKIKENESNLF